MGPYVVRNDYIEHLLAFKDQDVIKVIIGMRRSGKSVLMQQLMDRMKNDGVSDDSILYINMESMSSDRYRDGNVLYREITEKRSDKKLYIFIDEVQYIEGWERVVNSLRIDMDCDIYLTGSNAYMLSTDIATLLTGRAVEFLVLPFSLKELCELDLGHGPDDVFMRYLRQGGLPFIRAEYPEETIFQRIQEIKSNIVLKDICSRKKVDANKMWKVIDYLYSEIGNPISLDNMARDLGISTSTASEYTDLITNSMLFMKVDRYDIRGRRIMKSNPKYYCTDIGMRSTQPISRERDFGRVLENVVYLELMRRGGRIYIGKDEENEVDFIVQKDWKTEFYQVCQSISNPETREREYAPFKKLNTRGERYLIVYDKVVRHEDDHAIVMNIVDFLMDFDPPKVTVHSEMDVLMELESQFQSYVGVCREAMSTYVTSDNFDRIADDIQKSFFDLQATFRSPYLFDDKFLNGILTQLQESGVRINDALRTCANANGTKKLYRPTIEGDVELITELHQDIIGYIDSRKKEYDPSH